MEIVCNHCKSRINVPEDSRGRLVQCPNCLSEVLAKNDKLGPVGQSWLEQASGQDPMNPSSQPAQPGLSQTDIDALLSRAAERAAKAKKAKGSQDPSQAKNSPQNPSAQRSDSSSEVLFDADDPQAGMAPASQHTLDAAFSEKKTPTQGIPQVDVAAALNQSYKRVAAEEGVQVPKTHQVLGSQLDAEKPKLSPRDMIKGAIMHNFQKNNLSLEQQKGILDRILKKYSADTAAELIVTPQGAERRFTLSELEQIFQEAMSEIVSQTSQMSIEGIDKALLDLLREGKADCYNPTEKIPVPIAEYEGILDIEIILKRFLGFAPDEKIYDQRNEVIRRFSGLRLGREQRSRPGCLSTLGKYAAIAAILGGVAFAFKGPEAIDAVKAYVREAIRERHKETVVKRDFNRDGIEDRATIYPNLGTKDNDRIELGQRDGSFKTLNEVFEEQLRPYRESYERRKDAIERKYKAAIILAGDSADPENQKKIKVLERARDARLSKLKRQSDGKIKEIRKEQSQESERTNRNVYK